MALQFYTCAEMTYGEAMQAVADRGLTDAKIRAAGYTRRAGEHPVAVDPNAEALLMWGFRDATEAERAEIEAERVARGTWIF